MDELLSGTGTRVTETGSAFLSLLGDVQKLFNQLGGEFVPEQKRLRELAKRLASARFHLAVLGQFKRGKSTLLNALIGEELLPSAIIPLTSVPTFLSWGPKRLVKVVFPNEREQESIFESPEDARAFLARYVTERSNPKNHLGVARVEVEHPSPLLQKGVVLIDTPGIGSTFQHNTEATLTFLPQCDAALFLVSADPPVTQIELEFLKMVRNRVVRTIFLMNKVDYLSGDERKEAEAFFKSVLSEQIGPDGGEPVFSISARQGLEAKNRSDRLLWGESGMAEVEDYLTEFLSEEKTRTLSLAIARKAGDALGDGLLRLRLKQRSLTLPLEDLEQRLAVFDQKLLEIEQQREQARDLLRGDQRRIVEMLERQCADAMRETTAELLGILEQIIRECENIKSIEKTLKARIDEIVPLMFARYLTGVSNMINQRVQQVLGAHYERTNALAETIRKTASELFEVPYVPGQGEERLQTRHKPYWVTEHWHTAMSPLPRGLFERLLPRGVAMRRTKRWLEQDIDSIVSHNISNMLNATRQNIDDTFGSFALELEQRLEEVAVATQGAIQEARNRRMQKGGSVSEELTRLADFESRMLELQRKLAVI